MTFVDNRWAGDKPALEAAAAALAEDPRVLATTPILSADVAGNAVSFVTVRATEVLAVPDGVHADTAGLGAVVSGVFAAGPDRRADPRDWMNRISPEKQGAIATAAQRDPRVFLMMLRIVSGPVNVEAEETIQGVHAMRAAGLIDDADVAALLF